jgi:hypothetical protein
VTNKFQTSKFKRFEQKPKPLLTNFSGKTLPLWQGNLPFRNLFHFLEKYLELRHGIFSIVGDS